VGLESSDFHGDHVVLRRRGSMCNRAYPFASGIGYFANPEGRGSDHLATCDGLVAFQFGTASGKGDLGQLTEFRSIHQNAQSPTIETANIDLIVSGSGFDKPVLIRREIRLGQECLYSWS
jgi:hypothetical protein